MKKSSFLIFFVLLNLSCLAQNITNTLGTGGLFTIKDVSNNYLTLSQSTGQVNILGTLRLENTTSSSLGIIFKGTDRFLHNYQAPGTNGSNTFIGINAGNFTMSGSGPQASYNTGIGFSLYSLTTGYENTAMGFNSLGSNTTGYFNTALGVQSLYSNTDGFDNTAVGLNSLYNNSTGAQNTAIGLNSLFFNTSGNGNIAVGWSSLYHNTTGNSNTAVGFDALVNTTGDKNTALGETAGAFITTGSNSMCLGSYAQPSTGSASNEITLGNNSITSLRCNVTTITSLSDARDKKNISDLSLGLDFLMKVKPRQFNWDRREWYENNISDGSKMRKIPTAGFIAQELDEVQSEENAEWLNLVLKDNPEKWEATPGNLLPVVVKAIQELKEENDKLKAELESLKSVGEEIAGLKQLVSELKAKEGNVENVALSVTK